MPAWLPYVLVAAFTALIGLVWKMLNEKIDALWDQVGRSSDDGMRKNLHGLRNDMTHFTGIESRVERIEKWLNGKLK